MQRKFIKKILKFSAIISVLILLILLINSFVVSLSFKSQLDKPYYFIGDSTFEQGIIAKESDIIKNLSKSGNSLLYSFLKINQIIKNSKPKKIFISLGSHNMYSDIDKRWLLDNDNFKSRGSIYYPFMRQEEFLFFLKNENISLLNSSNSILKNSIKQVLNYARNKKVFFGGYNNNNENNLLKAKQELYKKTNKDNIKYSNIEIFYLNEIINLCKSKDVELFVINTPKHKDYLYHYRKRESYLDTIIQQNFSEINYINLSTLLNDEYFKDLMHLDSKGAEKLTNYIIINFIKQ